MYGDFYLTWDELRRNDWDYAFHAGALGHESDLIRGCFAYYTCSRLTLAEIEAEMRQGLAELEAKLPSANVRSAWAIPWDAYNDRLLGIADDLFEVVFVQHVTPASNHFLRYRFEIQYDTTLKQFNAAPRHPSFGR
jgi:hypothetical protein